MGEHDRALADYNEALRIDPKNQDTLANRGLLYMMMSDAKRALNGFERARSRVRAPDAAFL